MAELLDRMQHGWQDFQAYINTLTEPQLTAPKDLAGWAAKDHLIHLAVWVDGITAMLAKKPRHEAMGLSDADWLTSDIDLMNQRIFEQHENIPLPEVLTRLEAAHHALYQAVAALTYEDVMKPYSHYLPGDHRYTGERAPVANNPVIGWIIGDSYEHYAEHKPWIEAIVAGFAPEV
jgi:hypothetical protein